MLARGQFRHHAAIARVGRHLAGNDVGKDAPVHYIPPRGRGLVPGAFYAQHLEAQGFPLLARLEAGTSSRPAWMSSGSKASKAAKVLALGCPMATQLPSFR